MISRAASRTSSEAPAPFSVPSITAFSFSRVRSDAGILSIGVLLSQRPAQYRSSLIANQARVHPNPFPSKLRTSPARIGVLLLPVVSIVRPPDPTPSLQPHYEPSSLLLIGPPQCSASVLSPCGFRCLGFSLGIRATGSCSSAQKPASASRPLYAGRRLPSHQAPDRLVPEGIHAPGFDDACFFTTRLRRVHFRSSLGCLPARD